MTDALFNGFTQTSNDSMEALSTQKTTSKKVFKYQEINFVFARISYVSKVFSLNREFFKLKKISCGAGDVTPY
jgi:hypothetical protein